MLAGEPRLMLTWVNYVKNFSENNFIYVPTIDNGKNLLSLMEDTCPQQGRFTKKLPHPLP
jgi:hypothetical protein